MSYAINYMIKIHPLVIWEKYNVTHTWLRIYRTGKDRLVSCGVGKAHTSAQNLRIICTCDHCKLIWDRLFQLSLDTKTQRKVIVDFVSSWNTLCFHISLFIQSNGMVQHWKTANSLFQHAVFIMEWFISLTEYHQINSGIKWYAAFATQQLISLYQHLNGKLWIIVCVFESLSQ